MLHSIYCYPWDLKERGFERAFASFREMGLGAASVAVSYHAGKFVRPRSRARKVHYCEDGRVYFRPELSRYGRLKPVESSSCRELDPLGEALKAARKVEAGLFAWTVLLHNTRLGREHPDCACVDAWGTGVPNSLCPSNEHVREYASALVADILARGVDGVVLETAGFMAFVHGHHHEFRLFELPPGAAVLMGLCFCPSCIRACEEKGVDAGKLRGQARAKVDACLAGGLNLPGSEQGPEAFAEELGDEFVAFIELRKEIVAGLLRPLPAPVLAIPSIGAPSTVAWVEGGAVALASKACEGVELLGYIRDAAELSEDIGRAVEALAPGKRLRVSLRPGLPDSPDYKNFAAKVCAALARPVEGLSFYNWGHLTKEQLSWIGRALKEA